MSVVGAPDVFAKTSKAADKRIKGAGDRARSAKKEEKASLKADTGK